MAIDFYALESKDYTELLFQVEEAELLKIEEVLSEFEKITGIHIDPYGKTRLHYDFIILLIEMLEKFEQRNSSNKHKREATLEAKRFKDKLLSVSTEVRGIVAIGD